ncbi:MAG: hypothetical protein M3325_15320, partial [Actinomycetota bacterium]|nr:hypothetical protein [Actinomycetota bacterium]
MVVKRTDLTSTDWQDWNGIRIASPARLGLDLAARADLRGAVADLDEVLRAEKAAVQGSAQIKSDIDKLRA